jgi:hypothetical protein
MDLRSHFRPDERCSTSYERATIIFNGKREIFRRLSELNLELRNLAAQYAGAVIAARIDVPFRHPAVLLKRIYTASK